MRYTLEEIKAMPNVDQEALAVQLERPSRLIPAIAELITPVPVAAPGRRPRNRVVNALGQNKTEAKFDAYLAGEKQDRYIRDFAFEPFNLKLPGRTWLRIDFVVTRLDCSLVLIDVKGGPIEDDALVKLKVASEAFSWLGEIYVARYQFKSWNLFPVRRGRVSLVPDLEWMGGKP